MRYFGSKISTLDRVHELISERITSGTLCDPFGGTGNVGAYFKKKGYSVWCGDILTFAHYFQIVRVEKDCMPAFNKLCKAFRLSSSNEVIGRLNEGVGTKGWFTKQYAEDRSFFTLENGKRIDHCRSLIAEWSRNQWLDYMESSYLLASLINSMDKVANTAGTYYAYLKSWHRKAIKPFQFELLKYTQGNPNCQCFLCEAKELVSMRPFDIIYLDPPYNERCYTKYYHLPETIALGETPEVHGMSGMPNTMRSPSAYNENGKAKNALRELVERARFKLLAFHYSNSGLISPEDILQILSPYGRIQVFYIDSKGYTTKQAPRTVKHSLYLVQNG
jgi:adenine-specific DNA-methyltransferase